MTVTLKWRKGLWVKFFSKIHPSPIASGLFTISISNQHDSNSDQIVRLIDIPTDQQTDRASNRQKDRQKERQADT